MGGIRRHWDKYNEYCLLVSALADAGVLHIETSHPPEPSLRILRVNIGEPSGALLAGFAADKWTLARR